MGFIRWMAGERVLSLRRLLLVLLTALCAPVPAQANRPQDGHAKVIEVASEPALAAIGRPGVLSAGDVIVLSPLRLGTPHTLWRHVDAAMRGSEEPVYVIGRTLYEHVLRAHGLTKADFEESRKARERLADAAASPTPISRLGAEPGSRLGMRTLTALAGPQLTFEAGAWVFAGFDLEGYTNRGSLIVIGTGGKADAPVNMLFAGNRISNCNPDLQNCLWSETAASGEKRNGGALIKIGPSSVGTKVANNIFENLRGFVLVIVDRGSTATEVVHNTFRHLRPWADNAAEAVHLSVGFPLQTPEQEPYFSRQNNLIAFNLFKDAYAEGELIGVKGAGDHIIGNWIVDCYSGISLRDGRDTVVEENTIIRSYGIRVMGDHQTVRNNHIIAPVHDYGIWFENGAQRPGYDCSLTSNPDGGQLWRQTGPLSWKYRQARQPIVTGNTVEVPTGGEANAIARWTRSKDCGWDRCDGAPASRIPCDRQLSDAEMARILAPASGNQIRTISAR